MTLENTCASGFHHFLAVSISEAEFIKFSSTWMMLFFTKVCKFAIILINYARMCIWWSYALIRVLIKSNWFLWTKVDAASAWAAGGAFFAAICGGARPCHLALIARGAEWGRSHMSHTHTCILYCARRVMRSSELYVRERCIFFASSVFFFSRAEKRASSRSDALSRRPTPTYATH